MGTDRLHPNNMAMSGISTVRRTAYIVTFLIYIKMYPTKAFSWIPLIHLRGTSLAAYINPDIGLTNRGCESRNTTFNDVVPATVQDSEVVVEDIDIIGPGTLGDIMAESSRNNAWTNPQTAVIDGLVTKEGGELNNKFGCRFSPMERIALTANGNLQRIFSSYYDAPIHVHVDSCVRRGAKSSAIDSIADRFAFMIDKDGAVWDRVVHLHVHDQVRSASFVFMYLQRLSYFNLLLNISYPKNTKTLCKASSMIHVRSPECIQLIEEGSVGLGQLFRYLDKLPTFKLLDAGRMDLSSIMNGDSAQSDFHGGIWRTYELQCQEMTCLIHEEFHRNAWEIFPPGNADIPFKPML